MIQLTDNLTISTIRSGKGDCVHICFIGSSGQPHNIIVDSGPTSSAGEFRNLLTSIIRSGETLDALIITHYDDDHIGGILKACDPGFTEIYFNTYAEATETENLSATQNQRLFHSLDRSKIHSSVLAGDEIAIDGARIIVHAPKPEMLSRAMAKMEEANAQLASVSDWTCSLDDLMAKPYPSSDTSIANQSSIVFTFEYAGIRNLFCGDAWAENIPGGKYDLVKLPHHGSIRNISDALLSRIQADTFLICADGTSHPNKQTIAKLLQQYGNISIYSNYSWWMNGFLMTDDMKYIKKAFFEKYDDIISFEEWCHFYIRHGEYLKTKELYDSVFDERKYLIEDQPEYFYRSYIDFTLAHQFDLTPALRCFVEHSDEFKDIFIYMSFEMDLKFATCTFNDPDQMLDDVKILLDEGLYTEADYNEKCLIINMLNCRPVQAEQYAGWAHGMHPLLSSKYERMLLVWKGAQVMPNTHWNSMQQWIASQMFDVYKKEKWLRNPKDILFESCTSENKAIVVDLWTLYFFVKVQAQEVMSHFKTIYITYDTVSMALQEINQVNDDDIRRVLIHLQREGNVKLLSPTLEQQLTVRNPSYNFMEVHSACLLAQELNCPAFVGEFRFEIPEQLRSKVIRPDNLKEVMDCVMDKKLLEAE